MTDIEKALNLKLYVNSQFLISEEYHDLINVFEKKNADKLSSHCKDYNIEIDLKSEKMLNFRFMYDMSQEELQILQEYLDEHLAKEFIQSSHSSFAFSVLFARKSDKELHFCIDY